MSVRGRWVALGLGLVVGCGPATPTGKTAGDGEEAGETAHSGDAPAGSGSSGATADAESGGTAQAEPEPAPVAGPFSEARVQEIVRANFDKMGACYAKGLERDAAMKGTIRVSLAIDGKGEVVRAVAPKSDKPKPKPKPPKKRHYWEKKPKEVEEVITDTAVVTCVETEFKALRFPPTGRGLINLVYPIVFKTQ